MHSGVADAVCMCLQKYSYLERPRGKPQEQVNIAVDALARLVAGEFLSIKSWLQALLDPTVCLLA